MYIVGVLYVRCNITTCLSVEDLDIQVLATSDMFICLFFVNV